MKRMNETCACNEEDVFKKEELLPQQRPIGQVEHKLLLLEENVEFLANNVEILVSRLSFVLKQPECIDITEKEEDLVPLAHRLKQLNSKVRCIDELIKSVTNRTEL